MQKKAFAAVAAVEIVAFTVLAGSMATLGIMVAPVLFKTVTSADLAGRVFGKILNNWFWVGLICTLLLLATSGFTLSAFKSARRLGLARLIVLLPMLGLTIWFGSVMGRMLEIQNSLTKPIEEYAANANPRLEFDQLHKVSTQIMTINLGLSLVWLGLTIWLLTVYLGKATGTQIVQAIPSQTVEPALR